MAWFLVLLAVAVITWKLIPDKKPMGRPGAEVAPQRLTDIPKLSAAQVYCLDCAENGKPLDCRAMRIQQKTVISLINLGLFNEPADAATITRLGLEVLNEINLRGAGK